MKQILFIQGGGNGGYEEDSKLAASLQARLESNFKVHYPLLQTDEAKPDFGWLEQIRKEIENIKGEVVLVGHSLGASMLLKYLSENRIKKPIAGLFLISTPFWSGNEDWVKGLKLQEGFSAKVPENIPVYFYHCKDDKVVSFQHFMHYKQKIPRANFCEIKSGGHQINNDLSIVAKDIRFL